MLCANLNRSLTRSNALRRTHHGILSFMIFLGFWILVFGSWQRQLEWSNGLYQFTVVLVLLELPAFLRGLLLLPDRPLPWAADLSSRR
jgi:hypothetical protein